jgi:hypothetical protein
VPKRRAASSARPHIKNTTTNAENQRIVAAMKPTQAPKAISFILGAPLREASERPGVGGCRVGNAPGARARPRLGAVNLHPDTQQRLAGALEPRLPALPEITVQLPGAGDAQPADRAQWSKRRTPTSGFPHNGKLTVALLPMDEVLVRLSPHRLVRLSSDG